MDAQTPIHGTSIQPFGLKYMRQTLTGASARKSHGPMGAPLPEVGEIVGGQYELVRRLGAGTFGRVYVARRTDVPEHRVALKVVSRAVLAGRTNVERELVMLAAASHPNIVQLKDHGMTDGYVWLTMPLLEGETLAARLEQGTLGLREAYEIFLPVAHGLNALHAAGLRHQDIKPENIFLARFAGQLHPVLLDLGVAVQRDATFIAGTVLYAAPEQVMALGRPGAKPVLSEKIDTYCLASTLLRSLVGPEHFPGETAETPYQLVASFEQRETEPLGASALPELTGRPREQLARAFGRWLARKPEERASIREMAEELDVLLAQERELAAAVERSIARQKAALQRVRIAAGAMLLVGLGVAAWGYSKRETLRLAGELERARAQGAESFDKLDTCVASHELTRRQADHCAHERTREEAAHEARTQQLATASNEAQQRLERRLDASRVRLRACRDDATKATDEHAAEQQRVEQHWREQEQLWADKHQSLAAERDEQRRLKLTCEDQRSELAAGRNECRQDLAACIEDRDLCLASPPSSPAPVATRPKGPATPSPPITERSGSVAESDAKPPASAQPPSAPAAPGAPGAPSR